MRGKDIAVNHFFACHRITPAYAGKSSIFITSLLYYYGSPPPMRGKADVVLNRIDRIGITPAYAGKRLFEVPVFREQ